MEDHQLGDRAHLSRLYGGAISEEFVRFVGFNPLINPRDGRRYREADFQPYWASLTDHGGVFELIVQFAFGAFATILLIDDHEAVDSELLAMCREFATPAAEDWKPGTQGSGPVRGQP
jgi:hypothetical protein